MVVASEKGGFIMRKKTSLKEAFIELLKVKTLITLAVTGACVWGFFVGLVPIELFIPIVTMVLTHYFRKGKDE